MPSLQDWVVSLFIAVALLVGSGRSGEAVIARTKRSVVT